MYLLTYSENAASQREIADHLEKCKFLFKPPLDTYLDIEVYAQKIYNKSFRFEVKHESRLIGLAAVYFSSDKTFISNFSIEKEWFGKGVSKKLMKRVIQKSLDSNINQIYLDVFKENKRALKFYYDFGFIIEDEKEEKLNLKKNL